MLKDVMRIIRERRDRLSMLLDNNNKALSLPVQHQVYGAVRELDVVMRVLEYHHAIMRAETIRVQDMSGQREEQLRIEMEQAVRQFRDQVLDAGSKPMQETYTNMTANEVQNNDRMDTTPAQR